MALTLAPPIRDPITTHVLDSTTGLPAAGISVHLTLLPAVPAQPGQTPFVYSQTTSTDGRVSNWRAPEECPPLATLFQTWQYEQSKVSPSGGTPMVFSLRFDTQAYWGTGKTFYPEVEVRFLVSGEAGGHWHVPLLLGPWGYTTYRGS